MKEFKSIITHPEGQNLFPGQITTIEGYPHGTSITMKNTKPQIALTPYGATQMMPDMNYNFAGNTVVELPQAQMGGQDQQEQLMQMIQVYAEMKGMQPEELIQKIQSLPKDQQQQAIQSIAQEVQQVMAEQQQAQQQQAMMGQQGQEGMGQEEQMMQQGMMSHGGEPCFDCFDHYNPSPQAQDLNWYYKATGGEAFPQANMYPKDWASYSGNQYAQGGEAFPQAQTYLPNDRPHETRPNFMFQAGGQSDIDQIYQIMKKGGMDYNPKKKKGGKFDHLKAFNQYLEGGGGKFPYKDVNVAEDNYNEMMDERERKDMEPMQSNAYSNMKGNAWLDTFRNTTLDNYWDQPTSNDEKSELTGPAYDTEDEDMDWVANPFAEAESQFNDMQKDFGDGELSDNNSTTKTDNNSNAAENYQKSKRSPYDKMMQANMLNGAAAMTGNKGLFGAIAAVNNIGRAVGAAAQGWSHPGRAFGRQPKEDKPVYEKGFNRLDHSDMMQNGVGPKPESTLNKKVPALDTDRYNLNQNDVYDYSNISGSTQMQFGGILGNIFGHGNRRRYNTRAGQKQGRPQRHRSTGSCVGGNCYEFQGGGGTKPIASASTEEDQRDYSKYPDIYNTKGEFLGRYETTDGCPSWVPAEECAKYKEEQSTVELTPASSQVNRYFQVRQEGDSSKPWENKYWVTQQGEGEVDNQRFKQWKAPTARFANPNNSLGEWRSIGYDEYQKLKEQQDDQGRINYQELKRRGGLTRAQNGGPNVYVSPNQSDSYFNPLSGDIYLNEDQSHIPGVLPHEMHHYDQWMNGKFKVPGGAYMGEENLPESLNPYLPLMMPSIVRDMDFEGQMPYYNRRPIEQRAITNDFLYDNPSFGLVDPGLVYDKAVNPAMYRNPYTLEGEAQIVGDQYMGPFQRGGRLPKHQAWLSQTGNLSQPKGAFNTWNIQTPGNIENSSTFQAIQSANQNATRIADQNIITKGTNQMGDKPSNKKSSKGLGIGTKVPDFALGDSLVSGLGQAADYLHNFKERNNPNKDKERRNINTSEFMDVAQFGGGQYGDWSTNATQGTSFRPDEMVYAQKRGRPYKDVNVHNYDYSTPTFGEAFWKGNTAQMGGTILDNYDEEQEYDLTPEEIAEIIAAGGTIEYL